jgi:hypothetical protein
MNEDARSAVKTLLRQLFAAAGIVVLGFSAIFSLGDNPLFDFGSIGAFVDGLFRLAKCAALGGMAFALVRIWIEGYEREVEVNQLRRSLDNQASDLHKQT